MLFKTATPLRAIKTRITLLVEAMRRQSVATIRKTEFCE